MFIEEMKKAQISITENGAVGYKTTGKDLLDLNFKVPQLRYDLDLNAFEDALREDANHTIKWLLYLRDVRGGIGERKAFREFFDYLCKNHTDLAVDILKNVDIAEFGRWDDLVYVLEHNSSEKIVSIVKHILFEQLCEDRVNMYKGNPVSLLAKWLPSENTSSLTTRSIAKKVRKLFMLTPRDYRKILSELRKYIDVTEVKMSANDWSNIDYNKVPSKANLNYMDAFMRNDYERREKFLDDLENGVEGVKINSNSVFLHDIVAKYKYVYAKDITIEQMWKSQTKVEGFNNTLVVRDGSGSMDTRLGNSSSVTALDIANAITLYCAENNDGEYKNKFVTFSSYPKIIDVTKYHTLFEKLQKLRAENDCSDTNVESVFDLILDTARKCNMKQEELPANVLIISDMEFNDVGNWSNVPRISDNLFEVIGNKFKSAGYKMPKLIFWNVCSRTNTIPLQQNENGLILVSGFSKDILSMVMSSELDPYKALLKELDSGRYDIVNKIC